MSSIDDRRESIALATRMNAERKRLAAEYVAGLSDDQLSTQRRHLPSAEKKLKHPLTGRESPDDLAEGKRGNLLLFQRRVWEAAGKPGRSAELIAWENYE